MGGVVRSVAKALGKVVGAINPLAGVVVGVAGSLLGGAFGAKQRGGARYSANASLQTRQNVGLEGRTTMLREPIAPRRIVYGRDKISGPIVAMVTTSGNRHLRVVIALCEGPIDAVETVYFDDAVSTASKFRRFSSVATFTGEMDQPAWASLAKAWKGWDDRHRLRGVGYLGVVLTWDKTGKTWAGGGQPNVSAIVRGRRVYDPRADATAWSENPALCILDYIRAPFGFAATDDEIGFDSFETAAAACDELVQIDAAGATEKRYTLNGSFTLDAAPAEVLDDMLTSCAGILTYSGGKIRLHVGRAEAPAGAITEDDLSGEIEILPKPGRRERYNAVRGTFVDPESYFQPADFPPIRNPRYVAQDGGEEVFEDIELPFTHGRIRAQRLARIRLEKSRQAVTATLPCTFAALRYAVGSVVEVSIARLGWSAKRFRVLGWTVAPNFGGVTLEVQEDAPESWDWNFGDAIDYDPAPDTDLPGPFDPVSPPGNIQTVESLERNGAGSVRSRLRATWSPPDDARVDRYVVEWRRDGAAAWEAGGEAIGERFEVVDLAPGTYELRIASVSDLGRRSDFAVATAVVQALLLPLSVVSALQIETLDGFSRLTWAPLDDLNLSHYEIRRSPTTVGAGWNASTALETKIPATATSIVVPTLIGAYLIKGVGHAASDGARAESVDAAIIVTAVSGLAGFNAVEALDFAPAWVGDRDAVVVDAMGALRLGGGDTFADWPTLASVPALAIGASGGVAPAGVFTSAATLDLGEVFTSRATATIDAFGRNYLNRLQNWRTLASVTRLDGVDLADEGNHLVESGKRDYPVLSDL